MINNRNKLYLFIVIACIVGYIWLYFGITMQNSKNTFEVCIVKRFTNIPCPSCGSTRSVISIIKGNYIEALKLNPIGYIIALIMTLTPLWIAFDFLTHKKTFFDFYKKTETVITKKRIAIPLVFFVNIIWILNIL